MHTRASWVWCVCVCVCVRACVRVCVCVRTWRVRLHTAGRQPHGGRARAQVRRRRRSPAHLRAEPSLQYGSWAGRDAGWVGHVPHNRVPPPCRLGRCAVRPERLAGPYMQRARKKGRGNGRPKRVQPERPAVPDKGGAGVRLAWPAQGCKSRGQRLHGTRPLSGTPGRARAARPIDEWQREWQNSGYLHSLEISEANVC